MYLNDALKTEFNDPLLTRLHRPVSVSAQPLYLRGYSFNDHVRTSGMQTTLFAQSKL